MVSNNCGNVLFSGSTSITAGAGNVAFDVCDYASYPGVTVTVDTTGSITGEIEISKSGNKTSNEHLYIKNGDFNVTFDVQDTSAGYTPVQITGGMFSSDVSDYVVPGMAWDSNTGNIVIDTATAVASVNGVGYTSLSDAITAASAYGEAVTIKIIKSGSYDPFTINQNNVTIQAEPGVTATISVSADKTGNVNGENVTLKGLNFVSDDGTTIFSSGNCNGLTLDTCTFTGDGGGTALYIHKPDITIKNCTFTDFERGYYTCGDNHAAGKMTFTGNTFTNVRVPIDGYWGKTATTDTNIQITGNTFDCGDWDAAYIQLWDYAQYLEWADTQDPDRQGSAIKAAISDNTYVGKAVIYATHFNWFSESTLTLDPASQALLKYRVLVELENAESASVRNANGSAITAFNETTTSQNHNGKKVIYSICEGDYLFDIKPVGSTGDGLVTKEVTVSQPDQLGTTNSVSVSSAQEVKVAKVGTTEYTSLADAVNAANPGGTVELLANVQIASWNQIWNLSGITINGNGHSIKINAIESLQNHDAVFHSAGGNTFNNLTIDLSGISVASQAQGYKAIDATAGDKLNGVTVISGTRYPVYGVFVGGSSAEDETITITDCTFVNCAYAIGAEPAAENTSELENLSVTGSVFTNCGYVGILYTENVEFTGNTIDSGKLNVMHASQSVTGNTFTDGSRIKFYAIPESFEMNKISDDSYLAANDGVTGIDVSENYWGGGAPNVAQLGGVTVTGNDIYYTAETMNPSDLNTYVPSYGGGVTTYATTVESTTNGTVTVSPKNASKGSTVTITVKPGEGYQPDTITVTDKDGKLVDLTKVNDTKYTFKMPASKVTVKGTFTEIPVEGDLPFTDVAESAWYYEAVAYVYEKGMMTGTNDGTTFSPAMNLTRGMMARILYNLEKGTAPATGSFTDVAADAWYADAVNWAAAKGIVGGYGNGKFGPEDSITREQMAVILYNYAKFKGEDMTATADLTAFSDGAQVSDWAEYAMKWAVGEKLINGSNNALNPLGTASRAEVAQVLMNYFGK